MAKVRVSFNIDENIKYEIKKLALEKRVTATELYNKYLINGLEQDLKELNQE